MELFDHLHKKTGKEGFTKQWQPIYSKEELVSIIKYYEKLKSKWKS